jgi:serine/threonine protein kinase
VFAADPITSSSASALGPLGESDFAKLGPRWDPSRFSKTQPRLLNNGKFADLFLIQDATTKTKYVMKTFPLDRVAEAYREARVHMALKHPRIVEMYAYIWHPKYIGLVMEFVNGGDVFDALLATQQHPHRFEHGSPVWRIFVQVAEALAYLHKKGIIHTDIKPENVLMDEQQENIKLTDFDSAIIQREEKEVTAISGTTFFLPPEGVEFCLRKAAFHQEQQRALQHMHRQRQRQQQQQQQQCVASTAMTKQRALRQHAHRNKDVVKKKRADDSNTHHNDASCLSSSCTIYTTIGRTDPANDNGKEASTSAIGATGASVASAVPSLPPPPVMNITAAFDMWGLGIMLYEFCTLRLPFFGGRQSATSDARESLEDFAKTYQDMQHVGRCLARVRRYPKLSEEVRGAVEQLCQADPAKRMDAQTALALFMSWPRATTATTTTGDVPRQRPQRLHNRSSADTMMMKTSGGRGASGLLSSSRRSRRLAFSGRPPPPQRYSHSSYMDQPEFASHAYLAAPCNQRQSHPPYQSHEPAYQQPSESRHSYQPYLPSLSSYQPPSYQPYETYEPVRYASSSSYAPPVAY